MPAREQVVEPGEVWRSCVFRDVGAGGYVDAALAAVAALKNAVKEVDLVVEGVGWLTVEQGVAVHTL